MEAGLRLEVDGAAVKGRAAEWKDMEEQLFAVGIEPPSMEEDRPPPFPERGGGDALEVMAPPPPSPQHPRMLEAQQADGGRVETKRRKRRYRQLGIARAEGEPALAEEGEVEAGGRHAVEVEPIRVQPPPRRRRSAAAALGRVQAPRARRQGRRHGRNA